MKIIRILVLTAACLIQLLAVGCKPRIDSADPSERLRAVQATELVDQAILANISVEDEDWRVRAAAMEKLNDQTALGKVALVCKFGEVGVSLAAVEKLNDQDVLAKVAAEAMDDNVRCAAAVRLKVEQFTDQTGFAKVAARSLDQDVSFAALEKLNDQSLLAKVAVENNEQNVGVAAVEKLTNQTLLAKIAVYGNGYVRSTAIARHTDQDGWIRSPAYTLGYFRGEAVKKLTDEGMVKKIAVEDSDYSVRKDALDRLNTQTVAIRDAVGVENTIVNQAAVEKVNDHTMLAKIAVDSRTNETSRSIALVGCAQDKLILAMARGERDPRVRETAILLITNQPELKRIAQEDPIELARRAAIFGIADDDFILQRAREDPSPTVRESAVYAMHQPNSILTAALGNYYQDVRDSAYDRLTILGDMTAVKKSLAAQQQITDLANGVGSTNESELTEKAIHSDFDVICLAALEKLQNPVSLKRVAVESTDREVVKIAFDKLKDTALLAEIANASTRDPAVRIAASHKSGQKTWHAIFVAATGNPKMFGDAMASLTFFKTVQEDAKHDVQHACRDFIIRGDESHLAEMADLLEAYGSKELAEDYINSGQPDLEWAARAWASRRGFDIVSGGADHAKWGSGR